MRSKLTKVTCYRPGGDFFSYDDVRSTELVEIAAVVADVIKEIGEPLWTG